MKKIRIASLLLVLVLATSCFVGTTFARYTVSKDGGDSARVAKWGVQISVDDATAFAAGYDFDIVDEIDENGSNTTVLSANKTDKVVAPGTTGTLTGATVSGTPEVDVRVTYSIAVDLKNWESATDTTYCPLIFKVGNETVKMNADNDISKFELAIENAIANAVTGATATTAEDIEVDDKTYTGVILTKDYTANSDLAAATAPVITWTWNLDAADGDTYQNDVQDTALGDAAVNGTAATIDVYFSVEVTQIGFGE